MHPNGEFIGGFRGTASLLIDRSRVEAESDNEVVGAESSYTFTRRSLGSPDF